MKRLLSLVLTGLFLIGLPLAAASTILSADPGTKAPADTKEEDKLKEQALLQQTIISQKYKTFEQSLRLVAQRLERSSKREDKEKAAVILKAIETASKAGVEVRFSKLITVLKDSKTGSVNDVQEAIDQGEQIIKDLEAILDLLVKGSDIEKDRLIQKRLAELIKMLDVCIRDQKVVRMHTERGQKEKDDLVKGQATATRTTEEFAKEIEDKNQPGYDRMPGGKLIREAVEDQKVASGHLTGARSDDASQAQGNAIGKLSQVRDALDKLLQQMRDQERQALLMSLEARCQLMLDLQTKVHKATIDLDTEIAKNQDKKPTKGDLLKSQIQADQEKAIVTEAEKALSLLKEEGTSVAFVEVFRQVRDDMKIIARRLDKADTTKMTQAIEQDVIDTLKELVEFLEKARKPDPNAKPGTPQAKLLETILELRLIKSMQTKILKRNMTYDARFPGEPNEPEMVAELKNLADRQQKLQTMINDMHTQKTK